MATTTNTTLNTTIASQSKRNYETSPSLFDDPACSSTSTTPIHSTMKKRRIDNEDNYDITSSSLVVTRKVPTNKNDLSVHDVAADFRTDTHLANSSSNKIEFLMVHFTMLRALYSTTNTGSDDNNKNQNNRSQHNNHDRMKNTGSSNIDLNIWNQINCYLHQREVLLETQQRIEEISSVHRAAQDCCRSETTTNDSETATTMTRETKWGASIKATSDRNCTSVAKLSNSSSSLRTASFGIIVNVIGQQSKKIKQMDQHRVPALKQLLQDVTHHIQSLQLIHQQNEHAIYEMNIRCFEEIARSVAGSTRKALTHQAKKPSFHLPTLHDRSGHSETQFKIKLWSLLKQELNDVLKNHISDI